MRRPRPQAHSHAQIQPLHGSYIGSSVKESLICAGIWAIFASVFISGLKLWGNHFHPGKSNISIEEWAIYIGQIIGQFVLMTIYLSAVVFYRRRKNVTSSIFLDLRWWVGFFDL